MAVSDYSTNPDNNTSLGSISLAENVMATDKVNDAIRKLMADIASMYAALPDTSALVTKSGGIFTGNPTFSGAGGYLFNASSSNVGGKITVQASGGSMPSGPANGDWFGEY